jgi:hypothetical protein
MSATTEIAPAASPGLLNKDTYKGKIHPDWCPGCGDFSVLSALQTALFELGLKPHQVLTISGIGCSSNLPGYINTFGMHTLARPLARGRHRRETGQPRVESHLPPAAMGTVSASAAIISFTPCAGMWT